MIDFGVGVCVGVEIGVGVPVGVEVGLGVGSSWPHPKPMAASKETSPRIKQYLFAKVFPCLFTQRIDANASAETILGGRFDHGIVPASPKIILGIIARGGESKRLELLHFQTHSAQPPWAPLWQR